MEKMTADDAALVREFIDGTRREVEGCGDDDVAHNIAYTHKGWIELCDALSALLRREWMPCSERLPDDYVDVLVFNPNMRNPIGIGSILHRTDGISWSFNGSYGHEAHFPKFIFTHWMPLPDAPNGRAG